MNLKVGISIAGDAAKISRDYSVDVSPLEELSDFANHKLGDPRQQWGLSSLTKAIACKEVEFSFDFFLCNPIIRLNFH